VTHKSIHYSWSSLNLGSISFVSTKCRKIVQNREFSWSHLCLVRILRDETSFQCSQSVGSITLYWSLSVIKEQSIVIIMIPLLSSSSKVAHGTECQDCWSVNIFATLRTYWQRKEVTNKAQLCAHNEMNMIDHVFETWIRLHRNIFKKVDCPSTGSKWKIYSLNEERVKWLKCLLV
jgi:hypothetical protein